MTPAYMPFTYLPESTAPLLNNLVGPFVVYQPSPRNIPENLREMAARGLVEIRTPIVHDDDRVSAALVEFTEWVRLNPGSSTPGAGFFSARQGEIPFYDETTINRIRSDIKRHDSPDALADPSEAGFSACLFLAAAQENDRSADLLDHDLKQFKAQEKAFMDTMKDADDVAFNRESYGGTLWREDPGAKLTGQRIRAWSSLAVADNMVPELLVTTSRSVMDTLVDVHGETLNLERLAEIQLAPPSADAVPLLGRVLEDLATGDILPGIDISPFSSMAAHAASETAVTVTLFSAVNYPPAAVIRRMAPAAAALPEEDGSPKSIRHTLFLLVES